MNYVPDKGIPGRETLAVAAGKKLPLEAEVLNTGVSDGLKTGGNTESRTGGTDEFMTGGPAVLKTWDLAAGYGGIPLISGIDMEIHRGETILLCGANGSGKSTLLNTFCGLLPPVRGKLKCSDVMAIPTVVPKVKGFTVSEFLSTSCYRQSNWAGLISKETRMKINENLEIFGLTALSGKDISQISDGEFRKACIAASLVRKTDLLILDEPTAFMDVDGRIAVFGMLEELAENNGMAVIYSSHDISEAFLHCSRVIGITPEHKLADSGNHNPAVDNSGKNRKMAVIDSCFKNKIHIFER